MNGNRLWKRYSAMEGGFSFFAAVIAYLIVAVFFSLFTGGKTEGDAKTVVNSFAGLVVQIFFLIAAFLPAKALGSRPTYRFGKTSLRACLLAPVLAVVCIVGFEGLALAFNGALLGSGYVDGSAVAMSGGLVIALTVIRAVFFAPVCEEALFRGSVLSSLGVTGSIREKYRVPFMIVVSGLLFAVMHMNPMQTVYQFFLGCALAYATVRFGSILPAVIIHMTNNAIGVVLSTPAIDAAVGGLMANIVGTGWFALFIGVSVLLAVAATLTLRALCRKFGGQSPFSPDKEKRTEGGSFRNFSDDGGTLAGIIMLIVGFVICAALWIAALLAGFEG